MRLHKTGTLRVLDFDLENRPLSYLGSDFTTAEITAIAASWIGERKVHVWLLGVDEPTTMLAAFLELYDQAAMVTGHNIKRHDLPILNGALLEHGLPHLTSKLAQDTYGDLIRRQGISASQESLATMLGIAESKHHMTQTAWRAANRLTAAGIAQARKRVADDVVQHKALRERLLAAGALRPPRMWHP